MKEQKIYLCELCGTDYKEKSKAIDCEKGHKIATGIKNVRYHAGCNFPDKVEITFSDGTNHWYKV